MPTSYQQTATKPDEFMLLIFEGPHVGRDSHIAAAVVEAVVSESRKQGDAGRFHVLSITLARNAVALRIKLSQNQLRNPKQFLEEAKLIFGGIATNVYRHTKYHLPSVSPKL